MRFPIAILFIGFFSSLAVAEQPISESSQKSRPGGLTPDESLEQMVVAEDLELKQVLAEPIVKQPVFLNFDEKGRMWVVQYIQYPHPAGLKIVSHDQYWRNVYDKVPIPPPNHVRGKDKITIHEDTNGDGVFDSHKTFVDGLNMATAVAHGRGGHWVLNPPYLLFYRDLNDDDVPDRDPVVHLAGFGLEDSHSIANSLRWGPDGWLYGAQGSTVTANITRPGFDEADAKPIYSQGQNIWRYHPKTREYEVFAEGGGNAFGVEIDSVGRIYSGHNGGNTRGFHYPQGGYLRKGFTKHGPLSNPYAFGYFEGMRHPDVERFTHNFLIYGGHTLPSSYHGKLFGIEPIQGRVVVSDVIPNGSSFRTVDIDRPVTSKDNWFRPVDIKAGPDGAVYVCDWYDGQVNHYKNHEGNIDPSNGRIYRLAAPKTKPYVLGDLAKLRTDELIDLLSHNNRWVRQTALRVLGDGGRRNEAARLRSMIEKEEGQTALEALWALHQTAGIDDKTYGVALDHKNPFVRSWAIRLLGDKRNAGIFALKLAALAETDPNVEVRQQLAATARRLDRNGLEILANLLQRDEDAEDIYQPLMIWWGIETHCRREPDRVVQLFAKNEQLWKAAITKKTVLSRLIQRFAMEGSRRDLLRCAKLLAAAPSDGAKQTLMSGFEAAFKGLPLPSLPELLVREIASAGGGSLRLRVRQRDADAIKEAMAKIVASDTSETERIDFIRLASEMKLPNLPTILFRLIKEESSTSPVKLASIGGLQSFSDQQIADWAVEQYGSMSDQEQKATQELLSARVTWVEAMLNGIEQEKIDPITISIPIVRKCLLLAKKNETLSSAIQERWGEDVGGETTESMKTQVARISKLLDGRSGDVYKGQKLFRSNCGKCHKLFIDGGDIGPDLTTYQRSDVPNMVLNIVNPSAEIREGFENYLVITDEGLAVSGLLVDRDNKVLTLRSAEGQTVTIERESIEESRVLGRSLMPEGLLQTLSDKEIVDLLAYLRSTQPLNN